MIELNADVGEGMGHDAELLEVIDRANIACGFHAGDEASMKATVQGASERGVAIGAHVSYRDREGFGRRRVEVTDVELTAQIRVQIEALCEIADGLGATVGHCKAHGALYNDAAIDPALADVVVGVLIDYPSIEVVLAPARSAMAEAAASVKIAVLREGFPDRGYNSDGTLADRGLDGAVIHDPQLVARRAHRMATTATIDGIDGSLVALPVDTICVHGDNPAALASARAVRAQLGPRKSGLFGQQ